MAAPGGVALAPAYEAIAQIGNCGFAVNVRPTHETGKVQRGDAA